MSIDLTTDTAGNVLIVSLSGRLDPATAQDADQRLAAFIDAGKHQMVLDLADLSYASSAGLRTFLAVAKRLQKVQGALAFCAIQPQVQEVFVLSGLTGVFTIVPTRAEAIAAVR